MHYNAGCLSLCLPHSHIRWMVVPAITDNITIGSEIVNNLPMPTVTWAGRGQEGAIKL